MLPSLQGEDVKWDDTYYAEYSTKHQSQTHMRMISNGQWKLIRDFNNQGRDELYNLTNDPAESKNLIDSTDNKVRKIRRQLYQQLIRKMQSIQDNAYKQAGN